MSDKTSWNAELTKAQKYAEDVLTKEINEIAKDVKHLDGKEERVAKHVMHELEFDAHFAKHHIDYLERVINREIKRADHVTEEIAKAEAKGDAKRVAHLNERLEKQEADSLEHIEHVARHVFIHLEHDGKAAAKHIVHGISRISNDEDEFAKHLQEIQAKTAEALTKDA